MWVTIRTSPACKNSSTVRSVAREVAAAMSWSLPYTLGVFTCWKMAAVYCQAVLSHGQRIGLDGSPAEMVDAEAKELATKQLAQLEARKVAKKAGETARAAVVKPKPAQPGPTGRRSNCAIGCVPVSCAGPRRGP
jgi:hypothetical protein